MLRRFDDTTAKGVLIVDATVVTVEMVLLEIIDRAEVASGPGEEEAAIAEGQKGVDPIAEFGRRGTRQR